MHYFIIVIIPKSTPKGSMYSLVESMLEPYDENLEVDPYVANCFCVGSLVRKIAIGVAEAYKPMSDIHKEYNALPFNLKSNVEWNQFTKEYYRIEEDILKFHPLKSKTDPSCSECKGAGKYLTTSNPRGRWDWWVIGGRWDGIIRNLNTYATCEKCNKNSSHGFSVDHRLIKNNMISVSKLLSDFSCHIIITPDGQWHEENDSWSKRYAKGWLTKILSKYKSYIAIGCDIHC